MRIVWRLNKAAKKRSDRADRFVNAGFKNPAGGTSKDLGPFTVFENQRYRYR